MRQPITRIFLVATAVAVTVVACGGDALEPSATADPTTAAPSDNTTSNPPSTSLVPSPTLDPSKPDPSTPEVPIPTVPEGVDPAEVGYVTAAVDMLAEMTGADPGDIVVLGFEEVMWRDGSIGCPIPGMAYTQAIVDGTRVALEYDGDTYLFHAAGAGEPFYCEHPAEPAS